MKYKYIDLLPKPFLNDLLNNRVIPIVGAGFSKNADIPEGLSMPDWHELGQRVAEEIPEYMSDDNPIDALSYYEELYSRPKLVEFLIRELNYGNVQPGETYRAFCDLFKGIICTTNFDTLLEDTMVQAHLPVSVIATEDRLTVGGNNECKIIKLHGDFNHPEKMVITEKDYDVYIEKNPVMATYIANLFISNTMLLIGYSLDDNDYRGIWQVLHSRLGRMAQPAYCIAIGASEEKKARFQRRNIRIIDLKRGLKGSNTKANYKQVLFEFFTELKEYWYEQQVKLNAEGDPIFAVVANKSDLYAQSQVPDEQGKAFAKEINGIFQSTSAKSNSGINTLFNNIGHKYFDPNFDTNAKESKEKQEYEKKKSQKQQQKTQQLPQTRGVKLDSNKAKPQKKGGCC